MKVWAEIVGMLLETEEGQGEAIILEVKIPGQSIAPGMFLLPKDITVAIDITIGKTVQVDLEPPV